MSSCKTGQLDTIELGSAKPVQPAGCTGPHVAFPVNEPSQHGVRGKAYCHALRLGPLGPIPARIQPEAFDAPVVRAGDPHGAARVDCDRHRFADTRRHCPFATLGSRGDHAQALILRRAPDRAIRCFLEKAVDPRPAGGGERRPDALEAGRAGHAHEDARFGADPEAPFPVRQDRGDGALGESLVETDRVPTSTLESRQRARRSHPRSAVGVLTTVTTVPSGRPSRSP